LETFGNESEMNTTKSSSIRSNRKGTNNVDTAFPGTFNNESESRNGYNNKI
jgi:hypothetical protein